MINLEGNDHNDKVSLQYAHVLLNQWKISKDTVQGIDFHFGKKAKYWTLIEAINVLKAVETEWYMPYKNNLYAMYTPSYFRKNQPSWVCGCLLCDDVVRLEVEKPFDWSSALHKSISLIKDYWAPGIIFIIMTCLTIHKLYRRQSTLLQHDESQNL